MLLLRSLLFLSFMHLIFVGGQTTIQTSVTRSPLGDTFDGIDCIAAFGQRHVDSKCKCPSERKTLVFAQNRGYCENLNSVFNQVKLDESDKLLKEEKNVHLVRMINNTWQMGFSVKNVTDLSMCSSKMKENIDLDQWISYNGTIINVRKEQGGVRIELSKEATSKKNLEGRLICVSFECENTPVYRHLVFMKFQGSHSYNLSFPSPTQTPVQTSTESVVTVSEPINIDYTLERLSSGDNSQDLNIQCADGETYMKWTETRECFDLYGLQEHVFDNNEIIKLNLQNSGVYTYRYNGFSMWQQISPYMRFLNGTFVTNLHCPGDVYISKLNVQGHDGWENWSNDYFELLEDKEKYKIEFLYPYLHNTFKGHLFDIHVHCGGNTLHLLVKFTGTRIYHFGHLMEVPTLSSSTTTTQPSSPQPTSSNPSKNPKPDDDNDTLIIGISIGVGALVIIIIAFLVFCYFKGKTTVNSYPNVKVTENVHTVSPFERSANALYPNVPKSEKEDVIQLAEEIMRQRSAKQPDLVPRYVVPPRPPVDPRPRVGPLSSGYEVPLATESSGGDYLTLTNREENAYVVMNPSAEGLYYDLEDVKPDPTV